ncbi:MAG: tetratricopeptide repeat protein [Spartobacteria bacterium]
MSRAPRHQHASGRKLTADASRKSVVVICIALAVIAGAVYGRTLTYGFVNYDDDTYVYENAEALRGLSLGGIARAFVRLDSSNWHPMTTISHMLDCQLFGLWAGGHHFTNVVLHAMAAVLLFLVLKQITGALWRSALVAAIFAIHPLRVESVAWIAERKDVLMGVFFMLTVAAYARYARAPSPARYIIMSILFACGLMSKPMFVTIPVILLLLDYWPLDRLQDRRALPRLILEKLPLLAMSVGSSLVTFLAQKGTLQSVNELPTSWRIGNAAVSFVAYIWQSVWPVDLAVLYPHPENSLTALQVGGALAFLFAATIAALVWRKRYPYIFVGWIWYVIMLIPVIGLIQVGVQARADRYIYLPQIGLALIATWGACDIVRRMRYRRPILVTASILSVTLMAWRARAQTAYWRDSETLWRHTIAVTSDNDTAQNNLGSDLFKRGQIAEAMTLFESAVKLRPSDPLLLDNVAKGFAETGHLDEALAQYEHIVQLHPNIPEVRCGYGKVLLRKGRADEAIIQEEQAIRLRPQLPDAHCELGNAFIAKGEFDKAALEYQKMLDLQPNNPVALYNMAVAFHRAGRLPEAITYYRKTLALQPAQDDAREFLTQALRENGQSEQESRFNSKRP